MPASVRSGLFRAALTTALVPAVALPLVAVFFTGGGTRHVAATLSPSPDANGKSSGPAPSGGDCLNKDVCSTMPLPAVAAKGATTRSARSAFFSDWVDWNRQAPQDHSGGRLAVSAPPPGDNRKAKLANPTEPRPVWNFAHFGTPSLAGPVADGAALAGGGGLARVADSASISGSVLSDDNDDNEGDTGIPGAELTLLDGSGNPVDADPETPEVEPRNTFTDENGAYSFTDLPAGTYGVAQTQPPGWLSVGDVDGDNPDVIEAIVLAEGEASTGNDFVEELPGSLSGRVLIDDNGDGEGETGIEGVTILLVDGDGNLIDADSFTPGMQPVSNQTDPDGAFSFTDLPPGVYGLMEVQPDGFVSVGDSDGGNPDEIRPVTVAPGENNLDNDFVEQPSVAVGGMIFADTNASGFLDDGESGVPPVLVQLRFDANQDGDLDDPGEETAVRTQVSAGGDYNFTGLAPGNYQVVIPVPPVGYELSSPGANNADDGVDNDNNGIQASAGAAVFSPVINLIPAAEPDVEVDGSDASTDSTVDFALTSPKAKSWNAWRNLHPLGGENGPFQNPDGDLSNNLMEFAFCYDPVNGVPENPAGQRAFRLLQNGEGGFDVELIRLAGIYGLGYTLEYAETLTMATAWTNNSDLAGIVPLITDLGDGFESVRWQNVDTIPALGNGHGFVRIRVEEFDLDLMGWSEVQGWMDRGLATQSETISNPFLKDEVLSGIADAGSPQDAMNVATSASGRDAAALLAGKQALYVEIVDGPLEGHRFAVDPAASDSDTIALVPGHSLNTVSPIPDLSGAPFVVREAWRFGEVFPPATFQSGGDVNAADNILTFSPVTQSWTTCFLANLGGFGTYWVDSTDVSGPPPASQNDRVLDPSEGLYFHRRGEALTLPLFGIVRENDFHSPLLQGYNLVAGGYPVDQSFATSGMTLAAGFDGATDMRFADQVILWAGDTTPGSAGYNTFYLLDAGPPWQRWVSAGDGLGTALDDSPVFKAARSAFIKRTAALDGYTSPAPWVP